MKRRKIYNVSNQVTFIFLATGVVLVTLGVEYALAVGIILICIAAWLRVNKVIQEKRTLELWFNNNKGVANIEEMTPYEFEKFVAKLFSKLGYKTEETPRSGDEGIDVKAEKDNKLYAIQVKKTRKPVGSPVIQTLTGSMVHARADYGVCVSISGFTSAARKFAVGKNITLLDIDDLLELLKKVT